ncbi:MAG: cupin domain-containing protein [Candidatus Bathyarchaeia archaeon]|nr:cupin domain-containing protein [Candidatus Bathyarchaeota archaeon A05DMB-4]MDH7595754.1 cupin domain-containing protein [Candidatus Bathyarchaeota archaeon]
MGDTKQKREGVFPQVVTNLPEADVPVKGIRAWILQSERHQLVFFQMQPRVIVPEHSHDYPQWGLMIEGKMELTINGKTRIVEKGDEYVIPAKAKHSAKFRCMSRVMDLFSEKTRYKPKLVK